jgi:general stress protein 26
MTSTTDDFADRFWTACKKHGTGFLMLEGVPSANPHPMTAMPDKEADRLYFFTRVGNSLIPPGGLAAADFYYASNGLFARVTGELRVCNDENKISELWSSAVEAWLPEGKDSPDVMLLELAPADATIWIESKAPGVAQFLLGKLRGNPPLISM